MHGLDLNLAVPLDISSLKIHIIDKILAGSQVVVIFQGTTAHPLGVARHRRACVHEGPNALILRIVLINILIQVLGIAAILRAPHGLKKNAAGVNFLRSKLGVLLVNQRIALLESVLLFPPKLHRTQAYIAFHIAVHVHL